MEININDGLIDETIKYFKRKCVYKVNTYKGLEDIINMLVGSALTYCIIVDEEEEKKQGGVTHEDSNR